jgi:hypothetical protein
LGCFAKLGEIVDELIFEAAEIGLALLNPFLKSRVRNEFAHGE